MTFEEYLKSLQLTEDQVKSIVDGMPANKLYITSEENADTRMAKLKEQKEQFETDLTNANKLVADLQKSVKDNEDATAKITQYQQEAADAKAAQAEIEKTYAIKDALRDAGAKDIDYMMFKLGTVETDAKGQIKDLDSKVKDLQKTLPDYFTAKDDGDKNSSGGYKPLDNRLDGDGQPPKSFSRDEIAGMTPEEINQNWEAISASDLGGN